MGFIQDIMGYTARDAAKEASEDQYRKQLEAAQRLEGAGGQYATNVGGLAGAYDPYRQAGGSALQQLLSGLGLGGNQEGFTAAYRGLPGYQGGLETGTNAALQGANAAGTLASGRTLKDLYRFGSNYEDQRVGDYLSRLMGLQGQGLQATGAATGLQERGFTGQLGAQTGAANQMFGSSGTIGEGKIAGAQALTGGAQNLLNTAAYLGGAALGGGMGGFKPQLPGSGPYPKLFG